jgi:dihydrofolate synthase/folylpolyglutamate synthase
MSAPGFAEALDYLYSFVDYSLERSYRYSAEVFDLERMRQLLHRLGDPQTRYRTIHVAGTKGKGSVSSLVAASLQAAGYRTGLYTSPHLVRFTERFRVDGREMPEADLAALVEDLKAPVGAIPGLTTFELVTAVGFLYFARAGVEVAVIEVGLGGRLDATNIITPQVAVITSLSYDHMHLLGTARPTSPGRLASSSRGSRLCWRRSSKRPSTSWNKSLPNAARRWSKSVETGSTLPAAAT